METMPEAVCLEILDLAGIKSWLPLSVCHGRGMIGASLDSTPCGDVSQFLANMV